MASPANNNSGSRDVAAPGAPPVVGTLGTVNRRIIVWGPDGMPTPSAAPMITKPALEALASVALSLPYKVREKVPFELTVPLPPDASPAANQQREMDLARAEYDWEVDQEFAGLTNAEVMIIRLARAAAEGNLASIESMLDRALGRPKQSMETKSLTMSYADVLKEKAARLRQNEALAAAATVDAEVVQPPSPPVVVEAPKPFGDLEGLM